MNIRLNSKDNLMFRNLITFFKLIVDAFYRQETKRFENIKNKSKLAFFKTYFFNLLAFVKGPRKEEAAHSVTPGMKNSIFVNN